VRGLHQRFGLRRALDLRRDKAIGAGIEAAQDKVLAGLRASDEKRQTQRLGGADGVGDFGDGEGAVLALEDGEIEPCMGGDFDKLGAGNRDNGAKKRFPRPQTRSQSFPRLCHRFSQISDI
jgi:hypothetical protein